MKTILLPDALRRVLRLALIAWLVALAGCGPGSGGTGTGPEAFTVGPSLLPPGTGTGGSGVSTVRADCGSECPPAVLLLDTAFVELRAQCLRFTHAGPLTADGSHASLPGTLAITSAGETRSTAATLHLQFTTERASSPMVVVTIIDAAGGTALGPQVVQRTDSAAALPATPCPN